jgi:DNA-binding response OmpR family regulator
LFDYDGQAPTLEVHIRCLSALFPVWGYDSFAGARSIDRFVTTLRNKIEPDPHNPIYIHTVCEIGCKLEPPS